MGFIWLDSSSYLSVLSVSQQQGCSIYNMITIKKYDRKYWDWFKKKKKILSEFIKEFIKETGSVKTDDQLDTARMDSGLNSISATADAFPDKVIT